MNGKYKVDLIIGLTIAALAFVFLISIFDYPVPQSQQQSGKIVSCEGAGRIVGPRRCNLVLDNGVSVIIVAPGVMPGNTVVADKFCRKISNMCSYQTIDLKP